ncbi:MAG: DUF4193 family protein [Actinomycetota bacterium]|nr:DUF4193 family protein [Actinomycetota bacterium]
MPDKETPEELEEAEEAEDDEEADDAFEAEESETDDDLKDGDSATESDGSDEHDEETVEALEELESQELKLSDEEVNETLLIDEVKELRAMRREELTMNVDAQGQKSDEFVCQSCFMVKRTSQLANKRKMICQDCVA